VRLRFEEVRLGIRLRCWALWVTLWLGFQVVRSRVSSRISFKNVG
jgi:hypothetical protein